MEEISFSMMDDLRSDGTMSEKRSLPWSNKDPGSKEFYFTIPKYFDILWSAVVRSAHSCDMICSP